MNQNRWFASLAFFVTSLSLSAATPLTRIVDERSALIVAIHDVPSVVSNWEKSPWAKTWNDEQVMRYLAPLRTQMRIGEWDEESRKKTGYTVSELLAFATGDAILVVPDFDFLKAPETKNPPPLLIGIDVGDNGAKIEELFAKISKEKNRVDESVEFSGVTVHVVKSQPGEEGETSAPVVWAIVEGKWLLSPTKEMVFKAIDSVKNGGVADGWQGSERFARLQKRSSDAEVIFAVNVETMYPAIRDAVAAKTKTEGQPQGPFGFDAKALLTALGLDAWREFYVTAHFTDDATEMRAGLTYSEPRGLAKMIAYREGPPEQPAFVSANWATISTAKFSMKDAYAALEEVLETFNPAISGMVQGQIRKMNKDMAIDLRRDLIGSLGDTMIAASVVPASLPATPGAPGVSTLQQFLAFSLENPTAFADTIEAFRRNMGPQGETMFQTRDYLGQKIVAFTPPGPKPPGSQSGFSYSIANGYFLLSIGTAAPLETALQGMSGKQPSLWNKPQVKEAWSQMPAGASAFQYQDVRAILANVLQVLSQTAGMMGSRTPQVAPVEGEESDDQAPQPLTPAAPVMVDPSAQPDMATIEKYWDYSWGYSVREGTGVHSVYRIVYPR